MTKRIERGSNETAKMTNVSRRPRHPSMFCGGELDCWTNEANLAQLLSLMHSAPKQDKIVSITRHTYIMSYIANATK